MRSPQPLPKRSLWRVIWAMRPNVGRVLLATLLGSAALAASIALLGTSGWLISRAAQQPPVMYLMVAVVCVRAFGVGRGVLRYAERLVSHDVALRGGTELRETLFARLAAAPAAAVSRLGRGDLLTRIGADVDTLTDVVVRSLLPFATAATTCLAGTVAVVLILPQAGVILGLSLLIAVVAAPALAGLAARRAIRDTAATRAAMTAQVLALLDGLPELTVAGQVPERLAVISSRDGELTRGLDRAARPAAWATAVSTGAMSAAMLGGLVTGTAAVANGRLAPVMLAVLTFIPLAMAEVVSGLPAAAAGLIRAHAAAQRIAAVLDLPTDAPSDPGTRALPRDAGPRRLEAHGLSGGWEPKAPVVAGVDLVLPPGHRVAIVGASGSGKTTLLRTLAGLLPPVSGQVTLAGVEVGELTTAERCAAMSFTADDAHVFTTTVRENIRIAQPGIDDGDVLIALERAGLSGWLSQLRDGLDTVINDPSGPSGHDDLPGTTVVSGGERRRLLIARALASGASILLVDEPAEHLDGPAADALLGELFATGKTVVVVTHRLSPLAATDEVLVVADGRIANRGTHDWLIANDPSYRTAWAGESQRRLSRCP